jgi:hypothetical protein
MEGFRRFTLNLRNDAPVLSDAAETVLPVRLIRSVPVVLVQLPDSWKLEKDEARGSAVIDEDVELALPTRPLNNTMGLHVA